MTSIFDLNHQHYIVMETDFKMVLLLWNHGRNILVVHDDDNEDEEGLPYGMWSML